MYQQSLVRAIRNLDKLTVAAMNGVAIQLGLSLALACDYGVASPRPVWAAPRCASVSCPTRTVTGCCPAPRPSGHPRLPAAQADRRRDRGARPGVVHEVVEPDQLMAAALALAAELAKGPQVAMRLLKQAVYNALDADLRQAGDDIAAKTALSDHHPDAREGLRPSTTSARPVQPLARGARRRRGPRPRPPTPAGRPPPRTHPVRSSQPGRSPGSPRSSGSVHASKGVARAARRRVRELRLGGGLRPVGRAAGVPRGRARVRR